MEGAIVQVAAEQISNTAVAAVRHRLDYFINYKSNIENLRTQVKKLKDARERVNHAVEAANRNGENTEDDVQSWLTRVDDITIKVEKFFESRMTEAEGWCPNLKSRYKLSRKATKMAQVVVAEIQNAEKFNEVSYRPAPQGNVASTAFTAFKSRMLTLNQIMEKLRDPNINMIGVYGLSGVGKTTLVKEVAAQADKLFDVTITVIVKQNPDTKRIQGEMADKLGLKFDEETVTGRANRLFDTIKKKENILVILDDLWAKLDLEEVGIPFGDAHKGCKILLTSRTRDVLTVEMGTQKHFKLVALTEEEAWSLFEKVVFEGNVVRDTNLETVATEVANRCVGLPVLIVAVAKALKGKDLHVWKDALKDLETIDNEQMGAKAKLYAALELSYNNLGDDVKSMFLLCCLLPKYDITIGCLLQYAMGLGLLGDLTFEKARNKVHRLIDDLKGQCLLLDDETNEQFKMHDLIHDFAVFVASRDRHVCTEDWPKKDMLEKCMMISFPSNEIQELPEGLECPNLKLLQLLEKTDGHVKIPETFFKGMKNLKVMILSTIHLMSLPSLQFLKKLKMLWFDCCMLGDIAIIGELEGLEILRLTECDLVELPKEIGQLTCLRLLDLSNNPELQVIPAGVISSLKILEELYMANSFAQWEVEELNIERGNASLHELKHLSKLTNLQVDIPDVKAFPKDLLLEKLERYLILIGGWLDWNRMDETSRTLKLKWNSSLQLEDGIKTLLKKVDSLYLAELNGIKRILDELENKGYIQQLKQLHAEDSDEIQYIINSRAPAPTFPVLQSIFLRSLSNLEKICHGQLPNGSFGNLRIVKVKLCHKLKYLLPFSAVPGGFVQLQNLEINECSIMSAVFAEEREDQTDGAILDVIKFPELRSLTMDGLPKLMEFCSHMETPSISSSTQESRPLFNQKVSFPKLDTLNLSSINLEKIWDQDLPTGSAGFQNLTRLIVESCGNLKYLISTSIDTSLVQLKYLNISNCEVMEEVVKMELGEEGTLIKMFPKLESLWLKDLPNLSRFCAGSLIEFPLKRLWIFDCSEMKTFVSKSSSNAIEPLFNESVAFPNLEMMYISSMNNLKMIWHNQFTDEGSFCNLRSMTVVFCKKLQTIFPLNLLRRFQNLETLEVKYCDSLEEVFTNPEKKVKEKHDEIAFKLGSLDVNNLPKLKHIWNENFPGSYTFKNLSSIMVEGCQSLKYLIPASMVACGLEKIVSKKEGREIVFPKVTKLHLRQLPELESFNPSIHASKWPSLIEMEVHKCDKLRIFASDILSDGGLDEQPLFLVEKDTFPELKELKLNKNAAMKKIWHAQVQAKFFPKLEVLELKCFPDKSAVFPLGFLHTLNSSTLKKLVVSNAIFKDTLVPSSITLRSLTTLEVSKCHGLVNLITSSTARSLVQLTRLSITKCNEIGEIIGNDGGEAEEEIAFNQLKYLKLRSLSNLTSFYSGRYGFKFPSLEDFILEQCPKMNTQSRRLLLSAQNVERAKGDEMTHSKGTSKTFSQRLQLIDNEEKEEVTPVTSKLSHKELIESSKEISPKSSTPPSVNESVKPAPSATPETTISNAPSLTVIGTSKTSSQLSQLIDNDEEEVTPVTSKLSHKKVTTESSKKETPKSSTPSSANESMKPTSPAKNSETSPFVPKTHETTNSNALSSEIEEDAIEAFYALVGAKSASCQPTSMDGIAHAQCNKSNKPDQADIDNALEVVNNVLATRFSLACDPGCSSSFKSALELLCGLDEHDGITVGMKPLVLKISKDFDMMTQRFDWANEMIERRNKLIQSKAETEFQLNENKKKFLKLSLVRSNIQIGMSEVDGQIKALQQQINSLTEQGNLAKQEIITNFKDGMKLKDKLNDDVKKAGNVEKEKEIAERTKDELEEKWSGFTKQFLYIQKLNLMQISKSLGFEDAEG